IRCATTHRESLEFQATILYSFSHYFAKSRGRRQPTQAISKACSNVHRRCLQKSPQKYGSWARGRRNPLKRLDSWKGKSLDFASPSLDFASPGLDYPSPRLGFSFPKAWIFLPPRRAEGDTQRPRGTR